MRRYPKLAEERVDFTNSMKFGRVVCHADLATKDVLQ